jgi:hypothetical protein
VIDVRARMFSVNSARGEGVRAAHEAFWRSLDDGVSVVASSEDPHYPIGGVLSPMVEEEWRAAGPGEQVVQWRFAEPTTLQRIRLVCRDTEHARTQQLTIAWSGRDGVLRDFVHERFTFTPDGTTDEIREYEALIPGVMALVLIIVPDVTGGSAVARVTEFRVG